MTHRCLEDVVRAAHVGTDEVGGGGGLLVGAVQGGGVNDRITAARGVELLRSP